MIDGLSGSSRWWGRNTRALAEHFTVYVVDLFGFGESRGGQRFLLGEAAGYLVAWMDHSASPHLVWPFDGRPDRRDLAADAPGAGRPAGPGRRRRHPARAPPSAPSPQPGRRSARTAELLPVRAADAARAGPVTIPRAAREVLAATSAEASAIRAPTLVIWGEHDRCSAGPQRRSSAAAPGRALARPRGAGHNPMWDRPAALNRAVLDFIPNHPRAEASAR